MADRDEALSYAGAQRLAFTIRNYWSDRGYHVHVAISKVPGFEAYEVRSELRAGWPRQIAVAKTATARRSGEIEELFHV